MASTSGDLFIVLNILVHRKFFGRDFFYVVYIGKMRNKVNVIIHGTHNWFVCTSVILNVAL